MKTPTLAHAAASSPLGARHLTLILRLFLVLASLLTACAAGVDVEDEPGTLTHVGPRAYDCPLVRSPSWLGFNAEGRLTWFDGASGEVLALDDADPNPRADNVRDVSVDCRGERVTAYFERGDQSGELLQYDLALDQLSQPRHRADIDGWVRTLPLGAGVLTFEIGYGQRWRVLRDDGVPTASSPVPMPRSLWLSPDGRSLDVVLLRTDADPARLTWGRASLDDESFEVHHEEPIAWGTKAQLAGVQATRRRDGLLAAVIEEGQLLLAQLRPDAEASLVASLRVGEGGVGEGSAAGGRVEQVLALEPNAYEDRFLVLLSEPARLVAVSLASGSSSVVTLPAPVSSYAPLFSRALVAHDSRVWVATDDGVVAYDWLAGDEPRLVRDPTFDGQALRGPLAGPLPIDRDDWGHNG